MPLDARCLDPFEYVGAHLSSSLAVDFSRWVASHAPDGSSLLVLPFYAFVAEYQRQHGNGQGGALKFWTTARVAHHARRARDDWSSRVPAHAGQRKPGPRLADRVPATS
ncbi:hypothetical protein GCM10010270_74570 [Streptomyces violaceus]|nr:hypothetical protein GCM10010270_74570 [Streptomyces janthinus]